MFPVVSKGPSFVENPLSLAEPGQPEEHGLFFHLSTAQKEKVANGGGGPERQY